MSYQLSKNNKQPAESQSQKQCNLQKSKSQNKLYYIDSVGKRINDANYLLDSARFTNEIVEGQDIIFPIEVDCEYKSETLECLKNQEFLNTTLNVTTQMRHPVSGTSHMFLHQEIADHYRAKEKTLRHPVLKHPFHILDFLEAEGEDVTLTINENAHLEDEDKHKLPIFKVVVYAFFALADFPKLFEEEALGAVLKATGAKKIKMNRRLVGKSGQWSKGWNAPFILHLNGNAYRVIIEVIDTCAIHGNASYKEICANTGVTLAVKDEMQKHIKNMDKAYIDHPKLFDTYAMDDLRNYEALTRNAENMQKVWQQLGLEEYFKLPALTIGKTVDDIFKSLIYKKMGISPELARSTKGRYRKFNPQAFFDMLTYRASAEYLSSKVRLENREKQSLCVLAKCDGGRCRNAKPTLIDLTGVLIDIDIAGAYTAAMSQLQFPLGNPILMDCKKVLLRDWLKKYGRDLVPRLWYGRIRTRENLSYEQHLIPSWFGSKKRAKKIQVTEPEGKRDKYIINIDVDSGDNKILTKEVINGALTHDILQAILTEWPKRQRDDFLDKVELIAIGFYPSSLKVDSIEELQSKQASHSGYQDYSNSKLPGIETDHPTDTHVWTSFSLGQEFIDVLKVSRKQHEKGTPLNTLFKLIGNTAYGDSVSKYFQTSNMIVGNNITAMVRTMMYYSEIALNLCGSITDGQIFDLNKVLHRARGRYLNIAKIPRAYIESTKQLMQNNTCKIAPLNNVIYKYEKDTLYVGDKKYDLNNEQERKHAESYINEYSYKHVQKIFPNNDLLNGTFKKLKAEKGKGMQYERAEGNGIFEFEMKKFLVRSTHHGSANYQFANTNMAIETKMRSYESKKNDHDGELKKEHVAYWIEGGELKFDFEYYKYRSPAEKLMEEIHKNPRKAKLHADFIKSGMLKPNEFGNNYYNKWCKAPLLNLGDTIMKTGKFGYWSRTQFTFTCEKQYVKWNAFNSRLKSKWNIGIEQYFLDDSGQYVNYEEMVRYCDEQIRLGVVDPGKIFNKNRHDHRRKRPQFIKDRAKSLEKVKTLIQSKQFPIIEGVNDWAEAEEYAD